MKDKKKAETVKKNSRNLSDIIFKTGNADGEKKWRLVNFGNKALVTLCESMVYLQIITNLD